MPAPDPEGVWLETDEYGRLSVFYYNPIWTGKSRDRKKRAIAMLRKAVRGDWRCLWCRGFLPCYRRVDAKYCCEGCRKRAARQKRLWRCE